MATEDDLNALIQPQAPTLRGFSDYTATRKNIFDNVFTAVAAKFPLQNTRYRVELTDLRYGKSEDYSLKEQQQALMQNQSLYYPLKGKLVMRDIATGAVLDKTDRSLTLARVPYLTNRGTFINAGSEYTVANQARLLPGAYVRKRKSGEYEAHFNTLPGKGRGFRVAFMPDTGKFVTEIGQSVAPLYPMLKAYGVPDEVLERSWGKEIFANNRASSPYDAARIYERLTSNPSSGISEPDLYEGIRTALYNTELNKEVVARTLGARVKTAAVPMRGTLKLESEGYITVPAGMVTGVYYALRDGDNAPGISPVEDKGRLVVITSEEIKKLKKLFKSKFEATCGNGRRFTYIVRQVLPPNNGEWCIDIDCPELEQFRRSLLLDPKPTGGFRLAVGVKVAGFDDLNGLMDPVKSTEPMFNFEASNDHIQLNEEDLTRVTGSTLLRASQKVLNAQKGSEDVDDRDALTYQRFYGPEDFFAERIVKDAGGALRGALFKATNKGNLQAFRNGVFTPVLSGVLMGSGLGAPIEEVNPMEILDQNLRVIRTGEGGIGSAAHGIPVDTRSVQPSHLGFIDPVRTPESSQVGVDLRLTIGALKGSDGQIYSKMKNIQTGKIEQIPARTVTDAVVAFPGELARALRTGDPVRAMVNGKISYVEPEAVQYEVPSYANMFNLNSNLVPGISGIKGGRLLMGSKYFTQALPLQQAEAPLVQALDPNDAEGKSFEDGVSAYLGAVRADAALGAGLVTDVTADYIEVKHGKDKKRYELYNNFPFNRKCVAGATKVWIKRATGVIQQVAAQDYQQESGDLIRSINLDTKAAAWEPITGFAKIPNTKRLVLTTTLSGRQVVTTEDHSLVTLGDSGELVPIYPADCEVGVTRLPVVGMTLGACSTMDHDTHAWGLLAGLYLAEGHIPASQPNLVVLAAQPAARQAELNVLLTTLGFKVHVNAVSTGKASFTCKQTATWLRQEFGHGSGAKAPSEQTMLRSVEFRKGLIQGYMSGDGCLHSDTNGAVQLQAWTASLLMRDRLVDILASLGIFCTLPKTKLHQNAAWNPSYGLRVISSHINRLAAWFCYQDRNEKLNSLTSLSFRAATFDGIPVTQASRVLAYAGTGATTPHSVYKTATAGSYIQRHRIKSGVLKPWADSDVMWDTVVSITKAEPAAYVYDFEVASSQVFAVDCGLLVHNTYIHNTAGVKLGDQVKPGQLLAKSNYTDANGALAMGKNLKVAYMIWGDEELGGSNFEDGVVVSASAAKKMSSEHMYTVGYDNKDDYTADYNKFISLFPGQYSKDQLKQMDSTGVIKPGTVVNPGDPIILGVGERKSDTFGLVKKSRPSFTNRAQTWEHSQPGVVTDVTPTRTGWQVAIKSYKPMTAGDKLVGRYGDKGVISAVIEDSDMPQDKAGAAYEVIYNPLALVTRVNPVQAVEAALGKLAAQTGVPYKMPAFIDGSLIDLAQAELKKARVSDTETIFDPRLNKNIDNVFTGTRYFMNLHHQAEGKLSGRDTGGYSNEEAPVKGGSEGAKRIGIADVNSLLAHGAIEVLKDARLIRGQKNDEYWRAVKAGTPVPNVAVPFVWDKFVAQLKGAGVNVQRQGGIINIYGMTNSDVKAMSGGEVKSPKDIDFRTGKAVDGGFFDEKIFGVNQSSFGHFPLAAKVVNPVMEDAVRSLTGLTQKDFEAVVSGEDVKGIKGMAGLTAYLHNYDIPSQQAAAKKEMATAKGQKRSNAITKLAYLDGMAKRKIDPSEFLWDSMPVLPPRFRPITDTGSMQMVADMNFLYKELYSMNSNLKELQTELGADSTGKEQLALYRMVKATVGLTDPASAKLKQKNVNGLIRHLLGSNPKFSMFQRKVLSSTVEGVGNAVIAPDPSMDMDHVGVPEDMAFTVFRPYIIRALTAAGSSPIEAMKQVENKTDSARRALLYEMEKRPVLITRAPVLHKYNFMAAKPVLTTGNTMRMSPSVVVGFNADFDGDQMRLHVPSSAGAVKEAYDRMLPSRNLLSASTMKAHNFIKNEFLYGLFLASRKGADKNNVKSFRTKDDVIRAFNRGEIDATDTVKIVGGVG